MHIRYKNNSVILLLEIRAIYTERLLHYQGKHILVSSGGSAALHKRQQH